MGQDEKVQVKALINQFLDDRTEVISNLAITLGNAGSDSAYLFPRMLSSLISMHELCSLHKLLTLDLLSPYSFFCSTGDKRA